MSFYLSIYFLFVFASFIFFANYSKIKFSLNEDYKIPILTKLSFCLFCSILILSSCLRYGIGTDYFLYQRLFNGTSFSWESVDARFLFKFFIDLFNKLHLPFQLFVSFFAIVSLLLLFIVIFRKSMNPYLSVAIFLGSSLYSFSLSGFRQFAAIILVLYSAYIYTESDTKLKNNKLISLLFILIALGIHMTALPATIILYLIYLWKPSIKTVQFLSIAAVPITIILRMSLGLVNKLVVFIVMHSGYYSGYNNYLRTGMSYRLLSDGISLYNLILMIPILFFISSILLDYAKGNYPLSSFRLLVMKVSFCCELFYSLNMSSEMIDRFVMYYSISSLFLFPEIVAYCKWKWGEQISFVALLVFCSIIAFMYYRNLSSNIYEIVPYVSIFSYNR